MVNVPNPTHFRTFDRAKQPFFVDNFRPTTLMLMQRSNSLPSPLRQDFGLF
jgi:hypothetical protein